MQNIVSCRILSLFICAAIVAVSGIAFAQDTDDRLEEITVTGSRIARDPNLSGALPVQSITSEAIQLSGEFAIADVINDIPALLSSTTSESSIDSALSDGANVLDLRGLGEERTLVLVDGRRHVGGVQGSGSVDVASIPVKLIERVEVLTGGASAVYGADAVTGVVNFIMKDDYEGFGVDVSYGISGDGDGGQTTVSALYGVNFAEDRGNFTINVAYAKDDGVLVSDRAGGEFIGSGRDWVNPALRFQQGDISAASTPNFAQYYDFNTTGLTNFGLVIPTAADFIAVYNTQFGVDPTLTTAEMALINSAATAPQRAVLPGRTFPFTSGYGYIIPGNPYTFAGFDPATAIDLDGNGIPDCLDSFTGYNSVFGAESFGVVGGCWNITEDGSYRPVQDGLVSGDFQGFGGDSFNTIQNQRGNILLPDERISVNMLGHYDVSDTFSVFGELKYVTQETNVSEQPTSFWDLLFGAPDNPFLPAFIQPIANATGGVAITIDPIAIGDGRRLTDRDTTRAVLGVEGTLANDWTYEVSAVWGQFNQTVTRTNSIINDRFFAAIDAVTDPATGQPACRIEVDAAAPAQTTPFNIPAYDPGYFSFTPGAGQCVPLNIWAGRPGISQAAVDWVTTPTTDDITLEQLVVSAYVTGDTADWFELPAGAVAFAAGAEFRDEQSDAVFDSFQRGVIGANAAFSAGTNISSVSTNNSLVFRPVLSTRNEKGSYDTTDVFLEASVPLLSDVPGARELTLDAAVRFSDYSTIGNATTWKLNVFYVPVESLTLRGSVSEAVRAPNITELFGPLIGATFRPADPCDSAQIVAIRRTDPTLADQTQANCVTDFATFGLNPFDTSGVYAFTDPLSAAFGGVQGGNPDLNEETADTFTVGFVFQPAFLEGFSLTIDYWDITINDAISAVSAQNITDGCYQGATLNDNFCQLFTRNADSASTQFGGFNFLRSININFSSLETSGYDFAASYHFELGSHSFDVAVQGSKVDKINFFTNPADLSQIDVELGEVNRPELAGNIFLNWHFKDIQVGWQSQFMDEQLLRFVEIDTAATLYGPSVVQDEFWQHDLTASYAYSDNILIYGGIKNLTEEKPFITNFAFPASPRGRFFYLGVDFQLVDFRL